MKNKQISAHYLKKKIKKTSSFSETIDISRKLLKESFPDATIQIYINLKEPSFKRFFDQEENEVDLPESISKEIENKFSTNNNLIILERKEINIPEIAENKKLLNKLDNILLLPIYGQSRILAFIFLANVSNWPLKEVDELYLNLLASEISNIESFHLRKEMLKCFEEIKISSKKYLGDLIGCSEYLRNCSKYVSQKEGINYSVCIIRLIDNTKHKVIYEEKFGINNIEWSNFSPSKGQLKVDGYFRRVKKEGAIYKDEITDYSEFNNGQWMLDNSIHAYCCVPIEIGEEFYGSLSIFIPYVYKFNEYDFKFSKFIATDIAHTLYAHNIKEKLKIERNKGLDDATLTLTQYRKITDKLHALKNELARSITKLENFKRHASVRTTMLNLEKYRADLEEMLNHYIAPDEESSEYLDLNQLLRDITKELHHSMKEDGIELKKNFTELKLVRANRVSIESALRNILDNAIKACIFSKKKKNNIEINTYMGTDSLKLNCATVSIVDDGIGIKSENINKIYEERFSDFIDPSNSEKSTGKGLYLAKNAIISIGGEISAVSTIGKSTTFIISFPIDN